MDPKTAGIRGRLADLNERLGLINREWSKKNYAALLEFYVDAVPKLMAAERCGIFIVEPQARSVWSKAGTKISERDIEVPLDGSIAGRCVATGKSLLVNDTRTDPYFHAATDLRTGYHTRNLACAPILSASGRDIRGAIEVLNRHGDGSFTEADLQQLEHIARILSIVIDNVLLSEQIIELSNDLGAEMEKVWSGQMSHFAVVAESPAMRGVLEMVKATSATPVNVHLRGENGAGKEVIARLLHAASDRSRAPFVVVNCAAIPAHLVVSEFFGFEQGAFGGAAAARGGHFEAASGGTLFLDEIGALPIEIQPKFLSVLQELAGRRLGSDEVVKYDFRLISANDRDLRALVDEGRFRDDLYHLLFAVQIEVPPLRRRREDIVPLAQWLLADTSKRFQKTLTGFAPETLTRFERFHWPGNVRQLRREIERMVALAPAEGSITPDLCSEEILAATASVRGPAMEDRSDLSLPKRVAELEIGLIKRSLRDARGNKVRASRLLGITRQGLYKKLRRYHLEDAIDAT